MPSISMATKKYVEEINRLKGKLESLEEYRMETAPVVRDFNGKVAQFENLIAKMKKTMNKLLRQCKKQ